MLDLFGDPIKPAPDAFARQLATRKVPMPRDPKARAHRAPDAPSSPEFIGPLDGFMVRRFGAYETGDAAFAAKARRDAQELHRKSAHAIPMKEGQREYYGEPDRARAGLLQMQVHVETKQRGI